MENTKRTLAKTITWQILGLIVMASLGFIATGSFRAAGGLAIASTMVGTVSYILHERLWARIPWGRDARAERRPDP